MLFCETACNTLILEIVMEECGSELFAYLVSHCKCNISEQTPRNHQRDLHEQICYFLIWYKF